MDNTLDYFRERQLMLCIEEGRTEDFKKMYKEGRPKPSSIISLFYWACMKGNYELIDLMFEEADISICLIPDLIKENKLSVIKHLVEKGEKARKKLKLREKHLYECCDKNRVEILKVLSPVINHCKKDLCKYLNDKYLNDNDKDKEIFKALFPLRNG